MSKFKIVSKKNETIEALIEFTGDFTEAWTIFIESFATYDDVELFKDGESQNHWKKLKTLDDWRKLVTPRGQPLFSPYNGICGSCHINLMDHYNKTARYSTTGCPCCNRSFCD